MRLGPVARKPINPDAWRGGYPGPDAYVKEFESLLHFANQNGYLERFRPNLESIDRQRDKALNELRLAYLFAGLGFGIGEWNPAGANGKIGEFLLNTPEKQSVFVELKSRGWESELTEAQKKAGLAKSTKYEVWKGGAIGNWKAVHECIKAENCYPKFRNDSPNLLVMADDLRVSLTDSAFHVGAALFGEARFYQEDGYFTTDRFENIGELGIFNCFSDALSRGMEYEFTIYENPKALPATRLPESLLKYGQKFTGIVRGTNPRQKVRYL
jgi:hypothetical protein